jgi:hypothetical protein
MKYWRENRTSADTGDECAICGQPIDHGYWIEFSVDPFEPMKQTDPRCGDESASQGCFLVGSGCARKLGSAYFIGLTLPGGRS